MKVYKNWEILKMLSKGKINKNQILTSRSNISTGSITDYYDKEPFELYNKPKNQYMTFNEARRSGKKMRPYGYWKTFCSLQDTIKILSGFSPYEINEILDEKIWEINEQVVTEQQNLSKHTNSINHEIKSVRNENKWGNEFMNYDEIEERYLKCKICGKMYYSPIRRTKGHHCTIVNDELYADSTYACKCDECKAKGL